jgi:hypothetical protein
MLKINLRDGNFSHHPPGQSLSYNHYPTYFQWERENVLVSDTVVLTDLFLHDVDKYKNSRRKVAMLIEPPDIFPNIYEYVDKNHQKFDYILTFDRKLIESGRNFLFYPFGCCWVQDYTIPVKTKLCSMIASNKRMTQGHSFRQEIIKEFSSRVDHYGNGFIRIEKKEEGLRDYYFSIVIENSQPDYYFSEKLLDCIASRTIPIYWGSDISPFFNTKGILSFNTIQELEEIFASLTPELYNSLAEYREENFNKLNDYKIPEDWLYKHYPFLFDTKFNIK